MYVYIHLRSLPTARINQWMIQSICMNTYTYEYMNTYTYMNIYIYDAATTLTPESRQQIHKYVYIHTYLCLRCI